MSYPQGPKPFFAPNAEPDGREVLSVSRLNRQVRQVLESRFPLLWVAGEISNLTRAASGHVYFTLKDDEAQVRCTLWRNRAQLLPFTPANGMRVEVRALVGFYEARGEFQLNVEAMRAAGSGSLFEALQRLRQKLDAEGLFAAGRKRPLPRYPRGIGLISSAAGAALHDVLACLRRRAPHLPVVLYPSAVQGNGAGAELAAALQTANRRATEDGIDLLLLVRGGGSIEDLWAFNEEVVVRAIATSALPVVSGIGHESDFTLANLAADLRAATPTAAAELASAGYEELRQQLPALARTLAKRVSDRLQALAQRLDRAALRLIHPRERLARGRLGLDLLRRRLQTASWQQTLRQHKRLERLGQRLQRVRPDLQRAQARLDTAARRLTPALHALLAAHRQRLAGLHTSLQHLNPEAVLARGYSIVRTADGRILHDATQAHPGQRLGIQLARGELAVRVEQTRAGRAEPDGVGDGVGIVSPGGGD